jgi:hypothetical protein
MAINQLTTIRLADGRDIGLAEWSSRDLYSVAYLASGFSDEEIRLFSYIEGDNAYVSENVIASLQITANQWHTNISSANEMSATEEFLVFDIRCSYTQYAASRTGSPPVITGLDEPVGGHMPTVPVLSKLYEALHLTLEVSDKDFPQQELARFPAGYGPYVDFAPANALTRSYANPSIPSHEANETYELPIHIGGTENFNVILYNYQGQTVTFTDDAGAADEDIVVAVRASLVGLHKRGTK